MDRNNWVFLYGILLHLVWGLTLLQSVDPLNVTAISTIVSLGITSAPMAGYFYLFVAMMAILGLFGPKPAGFFFLLPQQVVLICSAFGAIQAMVTGVFADGVVRSTTFLIADQSPAVIAAIVHSLAVWSNFLRLSDA